MKQSGKLVSLFLLLGSWFVCSLVATAELTADQEVQPSATAVGETAMVTLMLTYSGNNGIQVTVTPGFTPGIAVDSGPQTELLSPGSQQMISYPIRAERSGSYWITSLISYADDGIARQLSKESPFTATGGQGAHEQPGDESKGEPKGVPQGEPKPSEPPVPSPLKPATPGPGGVEPSPPANSPPTNSPPTNSPPTNSPPTNSPPTNVPEQPADKQSAPSGNGSA